MLPEKEISDDTPDIPDDVGEVTGEYIDPATDYDALDQKDRVQARLKAVNVAYDTDSVNPLLKKELTRLSSYECGSLVQIGAFEALRRAIRNKDKNFSFEDAITNEQFSLRRSVNGHHLDAIRDLAKDSVLSDSIEDNSRPAFQG
jgi:hypothetical protein